MGALSVPNNGQLEEDEGEENGDDNSVQKVAVKKKQRKHYVLQKNEEFVDYKYYKDAEGNNVKRKKIVKRTIKKTKQLTVEQKEEIDHAFLLFDKDRSDSIDVNELKDAMKALGIYLKKEEVRQKMTKVDKDGSGTIDKEEFMALMAEQIERRDQEEELRKVFRIYDDDDNGEISHDNLLRCAKELGEDPDQREVEMMI